jgi:tetratricopeptide (TPR) repeat protein
VGRTTFLFLSLLLIEAAIRPAGAWAAQADAAPPVITPPAPALSVAPAPSPPAAQASTSPVISPPSPPPKRPAQDPARLYRSGLEALRAGSIARAQAVATRLMSLQPALGRQLMGQVKAKRGDLPGAIVEFDKALVLDAALISAREERAVAFSRRGEVDRARADLDALKSQAVACGKTCKPELRTAISRVEAALAAGRPPVRRTLLPNLQRKPATPAN